MAVVRDGMGDGLERVNSLWSCFNELISQLLRMKREREREGEKKL